MKFSTITILFFLFSTGLHGQTERTVTYQDIIWLRYSNRLQLNNVWQLQTELDMRRFVFPDRQHQLVLPRVQVNRKFSEDYILGTGVALFLQSQPQDPNANVVYERPELRPYQEINFQQSMGKLQINHRFRLEERFFLKTDFDDPVFTLRYRYQLQLLFQVTGKDQKRFMDIKLADELMLHTGKSISQNIFDQNRVYLGFMFYHSKSLTSEVGYMKWYQQRSPAADFFNRNILRFTLTHTIDLNRTKK